MSADAPGHRSVPTELRGVVPDPRTAPPVRWGILGAGGIASTLADAVRRHTQGRVAAVGSRDRVKAERFATAHGVPTTHVGYDALVEDPQVDVVYVATPHSHHREHALLAIAAGKHVLVEKAFTRDEAQAREVLDAARAAGVFVMEAMWTRHLPHVAALRGVIARGEIGDVVHVAADHGQRFAFDPGHRLYAPALAGGALLDLGVYPVSFAHDLLGAPSSVTAVGALTETGVDGQVSVVLGYDGGAQATLSTTLWSRTATTAVVSGTEGRIEVDGDFYAPTSFRVVRLDGTTWSYAGTTVDGFQFEAAEVARRVAAGETQSPRMSWDGTLEVMRTLDEVRRQVGVVYRGSSGGPRGRGCGASGQSVCSTT
ncbi:Gfo/Idh/MocA family protein [Cellulosimicrobium marinum]|uniref:Gfo/Idh/MocA family protein n=1 Tax=Cellulosimicrobium marinum TaxID=1638992 RepID=UPI001E542F92|nr:Gfo/Idh/MocA family oxidoreductase [Cellulosimicrobium marinum]MCB7135275.1 Gfo/Idh/MocA family oxidoreductase [Cellulosimicrobium marinum]